MNRPSKFLTAALFAVAFASLTVGFSFGPPPGFSGAPGELDCTACHSSYALNSGPDSFAITGPAHVAGAPASAIGVGFGSPLTGTQRRGFQITSRDSAGGVAGSWTLLQPSWTQKNGPNHVNHTLGGIGQQGWSAQWDAPGSLPAGPVTFYAAGNFANGNFAPNFDYIHTTSFTTYQAGLESPSAAWGLGTTPALALTAPTVPGHLYVLAVSDSIAVSTPLGGPFVVPLDISSPLTPLGWQLTSIFQNFIGSLGATGAAQAAVAIPNYPPLAGLTLHFAYATLNPSTLAVSEVSNRVTRTLQ